MRRITLFAVVVVVLALVGCSSDSGESSSSSTESTESTESTAVDSTPATTSDADTTATSGPAGQLNDQYGVRYCELLAVTLAEAGTTGEVWGTQGLNDCPQDAFESIDTAAVAADLEATAAVPNGPRYWVLDDIVANEVAGSREVRDFGGIEMRSIAIVDLGPGVPDRSPYVDISVKRDTEFSFVEGREIYELSAPDGSVYVMQSYSLEIEPTLTPEALAGLGEQLALPEGWTFAARVLDEPLVVEDVDGVATVVQDELRNTYQLRSRG